jgi:16S rRNA processing protein RimM
MTPVHSASKSDSFQAGAVVTAAVPDDLQEVGFISGAYGLNGWVKVRPFSADAGALLHAKTWWLDKPALHDVDLLQAKMHSGEVVASLMGVSDRNAAEALKGTTVRIPRSRFPVLDDGEFYWVDLIGLTVENLQGEQLGRVAELIDNGAHPILRVEYAIDGEEKLQETLIPFVAHFVNSVDQQGKRIIVDWARDY